MAYMIKSTTLFIKSTLLILHLKNDKLAKPSGCVFLRYLFRCCIAWHVLIADSEVCKYTTTAVINSVITWRTQSYHRVDDILTMIRYREVCRITPSSKDMYACIYMFGVCYITVCIE